MLVARYAVGHDEINGARACVSPLNGFAAWAARNEVELCFTPTYAYSGSNR